MPPLGIWDRNHPIGWSIRTCKSGTSFATAHHFTWGQVVHLSVWLFIGDELMLSFAGRLPLLPHGVRCRAFHAGASLNTTFDLAICPTSKPNSEG